MLTAINTKILLAILAALTVIGGAAIYQRDQAAKTAAAAAKAAEILQLQKDDNVGVEQWSRTIVRNKYVHLASLHQQHERFAKVWDNNLRLQGFAEAFEQQQQTPRA